MGRLLVAALDLGLTAAAIAVGVVLFAASRGLALATSGVGWWLRTTHALLSLRWLSVPLRRCYLVSARRVTRLCLRARGEIGLAMLIDICRRRAPAEQSDTTSLLNLIASARYRCSTVR